MESQDILFKIKHGLFSYRVAGVLLHAGKVLVQHLVDDPTYALPGGHVNFGEASEQALIREFKEEVGADIQPVRMIWIGENFFPWGENDCHQVCFYFLVTLRAETQVPLEGCFFARDEAGRKANEIEFCWMEIADLQNILLYPLNAKEKLLNLSGQIETFEYREG